MSNKTYTNIIFDLGAVLVDWNPQKFVTQLFSSSKKLPADFTTLTKSPEWYDLDRGKLSEEEVISRLSQKFSLNPKDIKHFIEHSPMFLKPLPEGLKLFNTIKKQGLTTYILSNASKRNTKQLRNSTPFFSASAGAIVSCEVKSAKPDPEIYQALLRTYKLNPTECLFIDDLEENILAGNKLGIDGIVCQNHSKVEQQLKNMGIIPS